MDLIIKYLYKLLCYVCAGYEVLKTITGLRRRRNIVGETPVGEMMAAQLKLEAAVTGNHGRQEFYTTWQEQVALWSRQIADADILPHWLPVAMT